MQSNERMARSVKEVAKLFGVSVDTIRRAAIRRELKVIRISKRLLVPEEEVQRLSREGLGRPLATQARTERLSTGSHIQKVPTGFAPAGR